jgi:hypothetical protein
VVKKKAAHVRGTDLVGILGYRFNDPTLLHQALTVDLVVGRPYVGNYRRLAFFGDRVVNLFVTERSFTYNPHEGTGGLQEALQKLVSNGFLGTLGFALGLDTFVIRNEATNIGQRLMASIFEAMVAAIFIDSGMNYKVLGTTLDTVLKLSGAFHKGSGLRPIFMERVAPVPEVPKVVQAPVREKIPAKVVPPPVAPASPTPQRVDPPRIPPETYIPDLEDPRDLLTHMVRTRTGATPVFERRKGTLDHRQVMIDVVLRLGGEIHRLGSGQGKTPVSAAEAAALGLLRGRARKLMTFLDTLSGA